MTSLHLAVMVRMVMEVKVAGYGGGLTGAAVDIVADDIISIC